MNIFKYSRGHFFGTLLPGAFLLLNVLFIYPSVFQYLPFEDIINFKDNQLTLLIAGFIVSYVLGVALRLMSPNNLERLALVIRIPKSIFFIIFDKLSKKERPLTFKRRLDISRQIYPYSNWFFHNYLPHATTQHQEFYKSELENEFQNVEKRLGRNFINTCKTYIYDSSDGLSEEVMYHEGLIRFICGIIYSLLIVLILLLFRFADLKELFFIYLIILIVFLDSLRRIRVKEVISILDGYMYIKIKMK